MKDIFNNQLNNALIHITKKQKTINDMYENPELIITQLFDPGLHQPYYDLFMKAIKNKETGYHSIQEELLRLLQEYFKSLDPEVSLSKSTSSGFPSGFVVSYQGKPFISFNVYNHIFGDFRGIGDSRSLKKEIDRNQEEIKKQLAKIAQHSQWKDNLFSLFKEDLKNSKNPLDYVRTVSVSLYYLIAKKKKILEGIERRIKKRERIIERYKEDNKRLDENIKDYNYYSPILQEKFDEWKQRFIDWEYQEEEKRSSKLY